MKPRDNVLQDQHLLSDLRSLAETSDRMWRSLPPGAFHSHELFELEAEHMFYRRWVLVGRVDQVPNPGDYFCFDVLDEPVVVVRGGDHELRVLSRVCRHRWMHVCAGQGNTRAFVCPYHAWTYELDGQLRHAPEMDKTPHFDRTDIRLPVVSSEVWEGFIFVNISGDATPLGETLAGARKQLAEYELGSWITVRSINLGECPLGLESFYGQR